MLNGDEPITNLEGSDLTMMQLRGQKVLGFHQGLM